MDQCHPYLALFVEELKKFENLKSKLAKLKLSYAKDTSKVSSIV